jgi:hypothetical protein
MPDICLPRADRDFPKATSKEYARFEGEKASATQKEVSMASVSYWQASWVSMEGYPMSPGDVHYWEASPLGYLEAWSVTAVPIAGGEDPTAILSVEDVRVIADASGSRGFLFNVKNVGTSYIDGYGMNFSIISQ